jgi:hypothetical protein
MEAAFAGGYDPALELATHQIKYPPRINGEDELEFDEEISWSENLKRKEQDSVDHIIQGRESGHYFMLLGPKVCPIYLPSWHYYLTFKTGFRERHDDI